MRVSRHRKSFASFAPFALNESGFPAGPRSCYWRPMGHEPRTPPTLESLKAYADGFNASLALRHFGTSIEFPDQARIRAVLRVQPNHLGGMGEGAVINGAVIAGLFDLVIGCTGALIDPLRRSATMQLSMSFERPVSGTTISAEAWIDRAGSSTVFSSAQLRNGAGEVCARCQGVLRMTEMRWDGSSPAVN